MKHMIKWLKISAAINIYLSFILTLVLIALIIDIGLDSYWHGAQFNQNLAELLPVPNEDKVD
jgi:hypothetical protein